MPPQSFRLVMRSGPNPGQSFDLTKNEMSIGRDISNDLVISDAEISRHHARLVAQESGYVIEDTGSTNGTFVNGQRLMGAHMLRPGELILLGENVSLVYEAVQYDADATVVSSTGVPQMPPSGGPVAPPYQGYVPPTPPPMPASQIGQPVYSGTLPPGPVETYTPPEEKRSRTWLYVGCGCLLIVLCLLVVGGFAFDQLNLYCKPPFDLIFPCP